MLIQSALVALCATAVAAVKPLKIDGRRFVDDDGNALQIVGMAYQPGGSAGYNPKTGKDPLSHKEECLRDAALMQVLGVNAIRVYNLDPDVNHDECASIFNAAGMYMMIDVNSPLPGEAITSFEPWTSYFTEYLNRTFAIVEAFSNYPNTLLFFSGNEIINDLPSAEFVPPYMRAITRDLKNYIKNNIDRQIPVGYSAADVRDVLWDTYNYVACALDGEEDDMSRADFFALNSYSWCGDKATFESSTFSDLVDGLKDTPIPVFFSEYGCNETPDRFWTETQSIYGDDMYNVFSGGVVYEWTQEKNDYGLVEIGKEETQILDDYNRLKEQLAKIEWEDVQSLKTNGDHDFVECAPKLIKEKGFMNNFTLPDLPPGASKLVNNGIKPKPSGKIVDIDSWDVTLAVVDSKGNAIKDLAVVPLEEVNWNGKNDIETGNADSSESNQDEDDEDAAIMSMPVIWAAVLPAVAMLFA